MCRKIYLSTIALVFTMVNLGFSQVERPKLVVGLMIDQMRYDYLYRFADRYSDNGFKRILKEGFSCENVLINYIPTYTAIGHTTVYTGSVPALHGITGNDWVERSTGKSMYCTSDEYVNGIGTTRADGKQSPRNLLTSTITDELKLATNFRSKVIGIAMKDRGGILPAGHFANAAYWFESASGNWISSSFYMEQLPGWVSSFNDQKLAQRYVDEDWNMLYPISTYVNSVNDDNIYEGKWRGEDAPTFPHKTSILVKDEGLEILKTMPQGNTFTLDFAKSAIEHEGLGQNADQQTDFLCISLSSTDYIGHRYSISSKEIEDTYLRLDRDIADFLTYLDKTVGKDQYTLFLTADHSVSYNPLYYTDQKGNGGYLFSRQIMKNLNSQLSEQFGQENLVSSITNYQVHLNNRLIDSLQLDRSAVRHSVIESLYKEEGIAYALDLESGQDLMVPQLLKEKIINGYNRRRSGAIQIIADPQWYDGSPRSTGTTHGVWSSYDSHIPLLFMGWGIQQGFSNKAVAMTDISPTIAALLHITEPNGAIGHPIQEVIAK